MSDFAWWYCSLSFTCSYHFWWPLPYFKVTAVSNSSNLRFYLLIQLSWNFIGLLSTSSRSWIYHLFGGCIGGVHTYSREITDVHPHLGKKNVGFFLDIIKARSSRLFMVMIMLGVYIVSLGLMTLTLFQSHKCVRNVNCKLHVLDSCPRVWGLYGSYTH